MIRISKFISLNHFNGTLLDNGHHDEYFCLVEIDEDKTQLPMKTLAIAFTLFASVVTTSSYASDGTVTPEVLKSFQSKFATAKNADWSVTQDLYKVQFLLDGQCITAFYNADGSMAAITRHISPSQLPVSLQAALKNNYKGQWIADLFELSTDESVQYYVTLEDANTQVVLKSTSTSWGQFQKSRKN